MHNLTALAVISGATMCSIGIALLLESLLLKLILGLVAKAKLAEEAREQEAWEQPTGELCRPASDASLLASRLG